MIVYTSAMRGVPLGAVLTHAQPARQRALDGRGGGADARTTTCSRSCRSRTCSALTVTCGAPLLAGGRVRDDGALPSRARRRAARGRRHGGRRRARRLSRPARRDRAARRRPARLGAARCASAAARCCRASCRIAGPTSRASSCGRATASPRRRPVCLFNRVDRPNVRGTLGVPFPGVDVAILPPADYRSRAGHATRAASPLPDGAPGEICVRGDNVSPGYVGGSRRRPAAPRRVAVHRRRGRAQRRRHGHLPRPAQADVHAQRLQHLPARDRARRRASCPASARCEVTPMPGARRKEHDIRLRVARRRHRSRRRSVVRGAAQRLQAADRGRDRRASA